MTTKRLREFDSVLDRFMMAFLFLSLLVSACAAAWPLVHGRMNHDVAANAYVAGRLVDGAKLYVDIIDVNVPFLLYFHVPGIVLGRAIGLSELHGVHIHVALWLFLALGLCWSSIQRAFSEAGAVVRCAIFVATAYLVLVAPLASFGQREHLMTAFLIPYLFSAAALFRDRAAGPREGFLIGVVAGTGLAIKPYFLAPWFAIEAVLFWRGRGRFWRPELVGATMVVGLSLLLVLLFGRDYLRVADMARKTYWAFNDPFSQLLDASKWTLAAIAMQAVLCTRAPDRAAVSLFLVAAAASLSTVFLQGKGFPYHLLPAKMLIALSGFVLVIRWIEQSPRLENVSRPLVCAALLVLGFLAPWRAIRKAPLALDYQSPLLESVVARIPKGESIFFFSTSVVPAFPIVNRTGTRWLVRYLHLLPLPAFYVQSRTIPGPAPYHRLDQMPPLEREMFLDVIADLRAQPPRLLGFDNHPDKQALGVQQFSFLEYFAQDPRFADFFREYRYVGTADFFALYERSP